MLVKISIKLSSPATFILSIDKKIRRIAVAKAVARLKKMVVHKYELKLSLSFLPRASPRNFCKLVPVPKVLRLVIMVAKPIMLLTMPTVSDPERREITYQKIKPPIA